ncbi:MAG: dTDP-4-dehydrorhamnose reductase, partial [Verrucomicrobiota bacterium]
LLPQMIAEACAATNTPWGHISSGCIYSGAKIVENGATHVEKDLTKPRLRELLEKNPAAFHGFTEEDAPNFCFRDLPCSFYSGTKAIGEEALLNAPQCYVWRLRIPFDEFDSPRNYLSKVQRYSKVYDNVNSISHRADYVRACLDLWKLRAPFGIYNVTNPGFVTTHHVVDLIEKILKPARPFEYWESDEEFYKVAAKTPRSNCILDTTKLVSAGVKIRGVEEALEDSLKNWKPEKR